MYCIGLSGRLVAFGLGGVALVRRWWLQRAPEYESRGQKSEAASRRRPSAEDSAPAAPRTTGSDLAQSLRPCWRKPKTEPGNAQAWLERLWRKCQGLGEGLCGAASANAALFWGKDEKRHGLPLL